MKRIIPFLIAFAFICPVESFAVTSGVKSSVEAPRKKKKDIRTLQLKVSLHCEKCVEKVNENIAFEKGVVDLVVSLDRGSVTVVYDANKTNEKTLIDAFAKLGYEAKVVPQNSNIN